MGSDRLYREIVCRLAMSSDGGGRASQVFLLDGRRIDLLLRPKLYAGELLDIVASHFALREKEYFGIAYADDTGHYSWLQLERRVLEHDFPKRQTTLLLYFRIKYFVESITHLRDRATVEAFYIQTQSLIYNGMLEVSSEQAFHLSALVVQATHGDHVSDELAKEQLKKLAVLPTSALVDHPSLPVCEGRVLEQYRCCVGQTRGTAVVNYMRVAESLPTYGVHYYEVKDKAGIPWWLGISYKGICQYDQTDRKVPRKLFLWKQLENLYFRDRKFSIEVNDPKRVTASRKTFGCGNICVFVWFASSPTLTKCIWSMACSQHHFYLNRKQNKHLFSPSRNLSDIADELSHASFCTETSSLGRSVSSLSLPAKTDGDVCDDLLQRCEVFVSLRARKEALQDVLQGKWDELKQLCLREGELTGSLPPETPLDVGDPMPVLRRKSGAEIRDRWIWRKKTKEDEELSNLELEYEIQRKILNAAYKLLNDTSQKKNVRRQRKLSHQKAVVKMKEIEQKLANFKKERLLSNHGFNSSTETVIQSAKDLITLTENKNGDSYSSLKRMTSSKSSPLPIHLSSSVPSSPSHAQTQHAVARGDAAFPPPAGYTPSTVYQTATSYRSQQYPTFSMRSPTSCSSASSSDGVAGFGDKNGALAALTAPYRNKFESTLDLDGSNLYSVPTQRTSQAFDSQDDASLHVESHDLGLVSRHNSLDRNPRRSLIRQQQFLQGLKDPECSSNPVVLHPEQPSPNPGLPHYHHQAPQYQGKEADQLRAMFHKNLQLYAADAMCVGRDGQKKPLPSASPKTVRHWTEFSATDSQSRTILSPDSVPSGCWPSSKVSTSTSMGTLKPQTTSHPRPTSNFATSDGRTFSVAHTLEQSWHSSKVATSTSMGTLQARPPASQQNRASPDSSRAPVPPSASVGSLQRALEVVSCGHFQPPWEETKPYETSDFYRYSTKHRLQHQAASHQLQTKLQAWRVNQSQQPNASEPMSPLVERSHAGSPASSFDETPSSHRTKSEGEESVLHPKEKKITLV